MTVVWPDAPERDKLVIAAGLSERRQLVGFQALSLQRLDDPERRMFMLSYPSRGTNLAIDGKGN